MKKLTCKDLGGPCDLAFSGESFEEIGKKSHAHVMEMIDRGDTAHSVAINTMKNATPEEQRAMISEYQRKYNEAVET